MRSVFKEDKIIIQFLSCKVKKRQKFPVHSGTQEVMILKTLFKQLIQAIMVSVVMPGMMFSTVTYLPTQPFLPQTSISQPTVQTPVEEDVPVLIHVLQKNGQVQDMELEAYVCGVVLGEMPASFEMEALKAQAVAARTYAVRCAADGVHKDNAVCVAHTCCQNYCDPEAYIQSGGRQEYLERVKNAVAQTAGTVAVYNGKPIFAAYFASSGGSTEDAAAVWGNAFPYLQSVESPGEGDKAYQNCKVTFTPADLQFKLGIQLAGSPKTWFGPAVYSNGGGVKTITIGGKTYTGVKLRSLLGLRSTVFTVKATDTAVVFTTNGYGHRVGMSQYGAEAMALTGATYDAIIRHYYRGVDLVKYPIATD